MKRNELGGQIEESLRVEKGNTYVEDNGYLIYWILDEMRKKAQADYAKEEISQGRLVETLPSFDFSTLNIEEIKELVEYGIKINITYTVDCNIEKKQEKVRGAIHNRIFDTGPFMTDAFDARSDYYSF